MWGGLEGPSQKKTIKRLSFGGELLVLKTKKGFPVFPVQGLARKGRAFPVSVTYTTQAADKPSKPPLIVDRGVWG